MSDGLHARFQNGILQFGRDGVETLDNGSGRTLDFLKG
jgi:hypothetical protein